MKQRINLSVAAIFLLCLLISGTSVAQVPGEIKYRGYLQGDWLQPVHGEIDMTFEIYDVIAGGGPLWEETKKVTVNNGIFDTIIHPAGFTEPKPYYLGVTIADIPQPRKEVAPSMFAQLQIMSKGADGEPGPQGPPGPEGPQGPEGEPCNCTLAVKTFSNIPIGELEQQNGGCKGRYGPYNGNFMHCNSACYRWCNNVKGYAGGTLVEWSGVEAACFCVSSEIPIPPTPTPTPVPPTPTPEPTPTPVPTVKLYRLYVGAGWSNHMDSRSTNESGFDCQRRLGYVYTKQAPGTKPLYQIYRSHDTSGRDIKDDHMTSDNLSEVTSGSINGGVLGYVHTTQVTGTIPLYRKYRRYQYTIWGGTTLWHTDHITTTDKSEGSSSGWVYERILGYIKGPASSSCP